MIPGLEQMNSQKGNIDPGANFERLPVVTLENLERVSNNTYNYLKLNKYI